MMTGRNASARSKAALRFWTARTLLFLPSFTPRFFASARALRDRALCTIRAMVLNGDYDARIESASAAIRERFGKGTAKKRA